MATGPASEAHHCEWRTRAEALEQETVGLKKEVARLEQEVVELRGRAERAEAQVSALTDVVGKMQHELETLTRRLLGPKSEKMPPVTARRQGPACRSRTGGASSA